MAWSSNIAWLIDIVFHFLTCFCTGPFIDCTCMLPPYCQAFQIFQKPNRIRMNALSRHNLPSHFFKIEWACDLASSTWIISTISEWSLVHIMNLNHSWCSLQGTCSKPVIYSAVPCCLIKHQLEELMLFQHWSTSRLLMDFTHLIKVNLTCLEKKKKKENSHLNRQFKRK